MKLRRLATSFRCLRSGRKVRVGAAYAVTAVGVLMLTWSDGAAHAIKTGMTSGGSGASASFDPLILSASQRASLSQAKLGDFQWSLVSDGVLTFKEYGRAVFAEAQCLADRGFEVVGFASPGQPASREPKLTQRGEYKFVSRNTKLSADASLAAQLQCRQQTDSFVQMAWEEHVAPSAEELQRARNDIGKCLRAAGISVSDAPSGDELRRIGWQPSGQQAGPAAPEFETCAREVQVRYDLPGFVG